MVDAPADRPVDDASDRPPRSAAQSRRIATLWGRCRSAFGGVSAQSAYLVIALIWGLLLCAVVPPFQQFDEVAHFYRAWSLSAGQAAPDASSRVTLPTAVAGLPASLDFIEVGEGRAPYSLHLTLELLGDTSLGPPVQTICFAGNPNPLGHVPATVGVGLARVLHLSPLAALYAARVANLLAAAFLVFFAIRLLPYGKPLFVLVGLLPMTITQFAAVSPDALTIAGAMLFLAVVLRLRSAGQLRTATLVMLVVTGLMALNVKPGYVAFAFLGFLIPRESFGSRRRWLVWLAIFVAGTFGVTALNQVLSPPSDPQTIKALYGAATQVDPAAQADIVLTHPGAFLAALRTTAGTGSLRIAANMVGIFGRGFVPLSQMAVLLVLAALVATLVATRDGPSLGWRGRALVFAVCGVTSVIFAFAMYLGATAVGAGAIVGLQGRYFIPVLAAGLFAVYGLRRPPRWMVPIILALLAVTLAASSLLALLRYYY
jgi:hypothetical protein